MESSSSGNREEYYPGTPKLRLKELLSGGRGEYCCVSGCKSARYHASGEKTGIGLFTFSLSDPALLKKWETVFMNIRRKGVTTVLTHANNRLMFANFFLQ